MSGLPAFLALDPTSAREHDEDERRRVGRGDRVEEPSRRRLPGRIGHGMSPRFDGDRADRRHVEPTRHDDDPPAQRGADATVTVVAALTCFGWSTSGVA